MAILAGNYEVLKFLKAWGIDIRKTRKVTIHIPLDDLVTVDVEFLPDVDVDKLNKTMIKHYNIIAVSYTHLTLPTILLV